MATDPIPGTVTLDFDPGSLVDASLRFIGHLKTPWHEGDCPRNLHQARERGGRFQIQINPEYRAGLRGLDAGDSIIVLYWMSVARRDLIVQVPSHRSEPFGAFALRSPNRPNTISLAVTKILSIDVETGLIAVDALDAFDGTPLLDIKPWRSSIDVPPAGAD